MSLKNRSFLPIVCVFALIILTASTANAQYIDAYTGINFSDSVLANGSVPVEEWIYVNINITNVSSLNYFNYTFNNITFPVYNSALGLMLNFDNITSRNEDNTLVNDSSPTPVAVEGYNMQTTNDAMFVKAMEFNGLDTMMNTSAHPVALADQLHAIILWFKTSNTSANQTLFEHGSDQNGHGIYIVEGDLKYIYRKSSIVFKIINYTGLENDSWYNVMATMITDNDTILLYVNGTLIVTDVVDPITSASSEFVGIGYSPDTNVFTGGTDHWHTDGIIDEVFYFDIPLFFEEEAGRDFTGNFRCEDVNSWLWIVNETDLNPQLYWFWGEAESVGGSYNITDYRAIQTDGTSSSLSSSSSSSSSSIIASTSSSQVSSSVSSSSSSTSSIIATTTTLIEYCNTHRVTTLISPYFNATCANMLTNETCYDKYQAAIPLDLYYLNYSNCEWNGSQCNTNVNTPCIILIGTTTTTTTTLCNMKITSAEPGIDLCLGDFCNVAQCVAGDRDYFGVWKYSGLKIDREYTAEQATWMAAFMMIVMALLAFAGVMITTVLYLTTKIIF